MFDLTQHPHRRYNPLTNEWVLVSPHRTQRPWQGQIERLPADTRPAYDPECYLCPGNPRAGGVRNPDYGTTFVFNNDFAALRHDAPPGRFEQGGLLLAESERGVCRVVCFNPRHDLTLARMTEEQIAPVIETWTGQFAELAADPDIGHVQIFENRGEMMGASNPHPHCQIWASSSLPDQPSKELAAQQAYRERTGHCLLCDYVAIETRESERVVFADDEFAVLVPFWAVWPFEVMIVSRRHVADFRDFDSAQRASLASALRRISIRYDNLFETPFPYTMGFHQRPTDGEGHPEWHFHAHYYPPLLRSATVRKFMVGFEMLATPQRDITPESAAQRLRDLPEHHYSE